MSQRLLGFVRRIPYRGLPKPVRPPARAGFFAPLEELASAQYENVQTAYNLSKECSRGQFREDGTRVFDHPKSVAWIYIHELGGRDPSIIMGCLLHDALEDSVKSFHLVLIRILIRMGVDSDFIPDLVALTKLETPKVTLSGYLLRKMLNRQSPRKETTLEYLLSIIWRGPRAILIKLCDRLHNIRNLWWSTKEKRRRQIEETERYHLRLLVPALRYFGGAWAIYATTLERLMREAIAQYK